MRTGAELWQGVVGARSKGTPDNSASAGMAPGYAGNYGRSVFSMAITDAQLRDLVGATTEAAVAAALAAHSSQITELLRGQQVNDVLWAGTLVLDNSGGATGIAQMDFTVSTATVMAYNLDAALVTIVSGAGGVQVAAPNLTGPGSPGGAKVTGVHQLKPNTGRVFPVLGGSLVVYGNASALVDLAVYAHAQAPTPS